MAFKFEEAVKHLAKRADVAGMEPNGRKILIEGNLGTVMGMQVLAGKEEVRYAPATVVLEDIEGNRLHKVLIARPKEESTAITEEDIRKSREAYESSPGPKALHAARAKTLEVMANPDFWTDRYPSFLKS